MKIYTDKADIANLNKNASLFVDTNALKYLVTYKELFKPTIDTFHALGLDFTIIPSIQFEFLRTDTAEKQIERSNFISEFCSIYPIERHLKDFQDLVMVIQKIAGKASYSDFLLYCCLYKFNQRSYLLTENHHDFKSSILDRNTLISIDNDTEELKNLGIYSFSIEKYGLAARKIIKELEN